MQSTITIGDKPDRMWWKAMEWDTRVRGMIGCPNSLVGKEKRVVGITPGDVESKGKVKQKKSKE